MTHTNIYGSPIRSYYVCVETECELLFKLYSNRICLPCFFPVILHQINCNMCLGIRRKEKKKWLFLSNHNRKCLNKLYSWRCRNFYFLNNKKIHRNSEQLNSKTIWITVWKSCDAITDLIDLVQNVQNASVGALMV